MPKGVYPRKSLKARFEAKVAVVESGCHEWQSTIHRDGYGKFWHETGQVQAHRMAYQIYKGEVPEGLWVLHKCDNRKCVNPEHLYLGDAKQNVSDMHTRGRFVGRTKFGLDLVEKAKAMYAEGRSQQAIADELGINQTTVSKYIRGAQKRLKEK